MYKDTNHTTKPLSFYNKDRADAYELSPNDETILLDADYPVLSNALNNCWGPNNELMMNWSYEDIMYERDDPNTKKITPLVLQCIGQQLCTLKRKLCRTIF